MMIAQKENMILTLIAQAKMIIRLMENKLIQLPKTKIQIKNLQMKAIPKINLELMDMNIIIFSSLIQLNKEYYLKYNQ